MPAVDFKEPHPFDRDDKGTIFSGGFNELGPPPLGPSPRHPGQAATPGCKSKESQLLHELTGRSWSLTRLRLEMYM